MATQGDQAVAIAKTWFGVPYLYGGTSRSGVDCSGLVQQVSLKWELRFLELQIHKQSSGKVLVISLMPYPATAVFWPGWSSWIGN